MFCCLINRVHFIRDDNMATTSLSQSRANFCEILATRIFRENANNLLRLTMALTTSWPVYSGADPALIAQAREERDDDLEDYVGNAIEMAILGKSKRFIKSSACQKVIDAIWSWVQLQYNDGSRPSAHTTVGSGRCVYQAQSSHSILSDVSNLGCISHLILRASFSDLQKEPNSFLWSSQSPFTGPLSVGSSLYGVQYILIVTQS